MARLLESRNPSISVPSSLSTPVLELSAIMVSCRVEVHKAERMRPGPKLTIDLFPLPGSHATFPTRPASLKNLLDLVKTSFKYPSQIGSAVEGERVSGRSGSVSQVGKLWAH
jgi:hypothetical protein